MFFGFGFGYDEDFWEQQAEVVSHAVRPQQSKYLNSTSQAAYYCNSNNHTIANTNPFFICKDVNKFLGNK